MPMRRRACRNALRDSRTRSWPSSSTAPALGSTSRLMQRISVLLPVPDGPMIAVMPRAAMSRLMSFSTGLPVMYDFERCRIVSMRLPLPHRGGRGRVMRCRDGSVLLLCGFGLALRQRVERSLVEVLAGALGDGAHDFPGRLVVDREEAVGALECLL